MAFNGFTPIINRTIKCNKCQVIQPIENFYVMGGHPIKQCKLCWQKKRTIDGQNRGRQIKQRAVDYLGGKCKKCGYNKSLVALDFNHLDPSKKLKNLSAMQRGNSWETIKRELDKCELLCANCHREHTANQRLSLLAS
jgi:hypothetical protein